MRSPARRGTSARSRRWSSTPARSSPSEFVAPAIRANALYGGGYPLFTALARPLIARLAVEAAREHGCDTIAHGCTGKGNDQVRIDSTIATLGPELRVLAPVREWRMGREEEIAYAREHRIPVSGGTEKPPYSIDDNLWGRSSEGGAIEDIDEPTPDDVFQLVTRPEEAPDEPELVRIGFEAGRPVSVDGRDLELVDLIDRVSDLGRRHGVGIVDHLEDRIVGLKVRDSTRFRPRRSSSPPTRTSRSSSRRSTRTTSSRRSTGHWAYLCYAGLWHEPLRSDLDAYMESANEFVTGEVTVKLYKGLATVVAPDVSLRALRQGRWPASASRAASSASTPVPVSSSCSRCRRGWPTGFANARSAVASRR